MYLKKVFDYAESLDWNIVFSTLTEPESLAVTNLPDKVKTTITKKLRSNTNKKFIQLVEPICNLMMSEKSISSLTEYLKPQDAKRAQSFEDYYPELYSEIRKCQ